MRPTFRFHKKNLVMRSFFHLLSLIMVLFMAGCSKTNNSGNGGSGTGGTGGTKANYAFANTEYNGISTQVSEYYQKPLAIHFNADSTVSAFSCFGWSLN